MSAQEDFTAEERKTLAALDEMTGDVIADSPPPRGGQAALFAALAKAQGAFPPIPRDRTVKVQTKTGGSYTFAYAPLDTILDKVRPALAKNNLAVTQTFRGGALVTSLLHADGGMIESVFPLERGSLSWQEFGSAQTYARRYMLVALLGVASEEDDDGNAASGNRAEPAAKKPSATPDPKPTAGFDRTKAFKAVKAIERKLLGAGLTEEQFTTQVEANYGTPHVSELDDEQLADLLEKLRGAERHVEA